MEETRLNEIKVALDFNSEVVRKKYLSFRTGMQLVAIPILNVE